LFKHTNGSLNSSQVGCRRVVPVSSTCSNVINFDLHSTACSCIGCVCCRWIVSVTTGNIAPLLSTVASHVLQGWTKHWWCTGARRKTLWRGAKVKQSVGFVLERHIGGFCWYDIGRRVWPYLVARTGEPFLIGLKWRVRGLRATTVGWKLVSRGCCEAFLVWFEDRWRVSESARRYLSSLGLWVILLFYSGVAGRWVLC
jgi:hypothetical protein